MANKTTIAELIAAKKQGTKISCVACYDYTTAKIVSETDVDLILVGDSASQMVLGYDSTLPVTMDFMAAITAGVRRGAPDVCLAADMPFLSYQLGTSEAVKNAGRFAAQAGADIIKIEVSSAYVDIVKAVSDAGMAVMAHIGIRPQTISKMGKFRAEGTTAEIAIDLISLADQMVQAGASMLLIEGAAAEVAGIITERVDIPVISCGSGLLCDGQILIAPDILGIYKGKGPKFAKSFANVGEETTKAFAEYSRQVKSGKFPDDAHSYHMKSGQLEKLQEILKSTS
jgi:3-methyl-2-oxobutanoate hydroxymethyltransferase